MDSPQDSPSPAPTSTTTVQRNIEEKLGVFNLRVLLMILSFVNEKFKEAPPSLMEHLLKLERDRSDSYSGIINYTFKRLKVNPALFFTPDRDTVELPSEQAAGIELRLALVDFLLSFNDEQTASRAIKKIAEGSSLLVLQMTPLEIIEEVCKSGSVEDVVSISNSVAAEFNRAGFFDHLQDPADWLHNGKYNIVNYQ